jgi:hypothetical protein
VLLVEDAAFCEETPAATVECVKERKIDISANCDYVYVQGLRFRTWDVAVIWKDPDGVEHLVSLGKSGTGKAVFDERGIPDRLTPKDLKKRLKKGETIDVMVLPSAPEEDPEDRNAVRLVTESVRLRLDPRCAEGRRGRQDFAKSRSAESLAGLPPETLRSLAFTQMVTAPYGENNRGEAIERILWSLGHLDDKSIELLLTVDVSGLTLVYPSRSSTNLELSSLLLSDERLVSTLIETGKHASIGRLEHNSTVASATLAGAAARPAHEVLESAALKLLRGEQARSVGRRLPQDPLDQYGRERGLVRMRAVGHIRNQEVLEEVLATDSDPSVRIAAIGQLTLWAQEVTPGRPARQSVRDAVTGDPAPTVRLHALRRVDTDEDISWDERETLVFDVALLDPDGYVRGKALELLETDRALLDVATDTVVDPGTSRTARDMVFARIAAGGVPRRRAGMVEYRTDGGMRAQAHTSKMGETRSVEGLTMDVARSDNREMLERLVDTLGAPSSFSGSYAANAALRAVQALLDNPATTDELYAKAFALSKELTTARDAAKLREAKDRAKKEEDQWRARLVSICAERRDEIRVGLRHARAGNMSRAAEFLAGDSALNLYAAAAGLSDAEEIREFKKVVDRARDLLNAHGSAPDPRVTDYRSLDVQKRLYEYMRSNPATPADMLPGIDASLRDLKFRSAAVRWHAGLEIVEDPAATSEDLASALSRAAQDEDLSGWNHVLAEIRNHPNATQEQKDAATALLDAWRARGMP